RGTGKELIAHRLHYLSARWDQSFVTINCATLSESLLETELFGHEAGSFTGAAKRHQGRFERADGGTLFLDELATTSARVQEKLLRVIEYGEFERVGGAKPLKVDVRLVCATNEDLPALADRGQFRHDLLDRLAFDVITLPPLRERREDILMLAEHFAHSMTRELGYPLFAGFSRKATQLLQDYHWPGNVRELKNVVERSIYRQGNPQLPLSTLVINPFDSPWRPGAKSNPPLPEGPGEAPIATAMSLPLELKQAVAEFEINLLKQAMQQSQYNQRKAAQLLALRYHQFRGMLRKYQLLNDDNEAEQEQKESDL
ncbi:MAG: phage shock protein operon transcriptional activator, partial [Aeromonas sobria]